MKIKLFEQFENDPFGEDRIFHMLPLEKAGSLNTINKNVFFIGVKQFENYIKRVFNYDDYDFERCESDDNSPLTYLVTSGEFDNADSDTCREQFEQLRKGNRPTDVWAISLFKILVIDGYIKPGIYVIIPEKDDNYVSMEDLMKL